MSDWSHSDFLSPGTLLYTRESNCSASPAAHDVAL